mgnify:CR=1 FL=1
MHVFKNQLVIYEVFYFLNDLHHTLRIVDFEMPAFIGLTFKVRVYLIDLFGDSPVNICNVCR